MVVVLSIVTAVLIKPANYDTGTMTVDAEAKRLLADVRFVQSLSMFRNQRFRLDLSNSSQYRILTGLGTAYNYFAAGGTTVSLNSGTTLSFSATNKYLVFTGLGIPAVSSSSSGVGSDISSVETITLTNSGHSETITIYPYTGLASST